LAIHLSWSMRLLRVRNAAHESVRESVALFGVGADLAVHRRLPGCVRRLLLASLA